MIETERLQLNWLSAEAMEALLRGRRDALPYAVPPDWPDEHDARFLRLRLRQLHLDPSRVEWGVAAIVLREADELIGHIGFHGPPGANARREPDAVELGYTVFPEHRRRGYATEAVRGLLEYARERGVHRFVASVAPTNEPSLRLVRGLGFVEAGRHWDEEDGEELELVLHDPPAG
ncbi:MAG TPA: GNAT family N-acetyltransferase [Gaiellaceae bacterium]|nr:GNAT family N-acetyltransferase [Gaiellaceae bacterium]